LMMRDAVAVETPARRATSAKVAMTIALPGRRPPGACAAGSP
jgi:hypothetical protein